MTIQKSFTTMALSSLLIISASSIAMAKQASSELTPKEELGKAIFFDNISSPNWMSCSTCHAPQTGWTGAVGGINVHGAVSRGATPQRFGNRKPPSAAYATQSPIFHYDEEEALFIGGNFWDGRATGELLGNPAADQAMAPFLNPVEQNNGTMTSVLEQIADSKYSELWEQVWGEAISVENEEKIQLNYNRVGLTLGAYEASPDVNQFSSKYDAYLNGEVNLSEEEERGLELFNEKGNCAACHPSALGKNGESPLFTDYSFDNLAVPRNPENPFYDMDSVYLDDGSAINPEGKEWVDVGLSGFLETKTIWAHLASQNRGKQKVPTLRNVDKRYGEGYPKAYTHNGYFKSLRSIVHFYNTRDTKEVCEDPFTTEKDALKMNCWPEAEIMDNVNDDELGNLELTQQEEDDIVTFLKTLSDGYEVKKNK